MRDPHTFFVNHLHLTNFGSKIYYSHFEIQDRPEKGEGWAITMRHNKIIGTKGFVVLKQSGGHGLSRLIFLILSF